MLPAIQFDNQFFLKTGKIGNKLSNGMLPPEFMIIQLTVSDMPPEQLFCLSLVRS